MAAVNSLLFLLTTLVPNTERPQASTEPFWGGNSTTFNRDSPVTCGPNEHFESCGTFCPKTCYNYNESTTCIGGCRAGCFCDDPLVRDRDGRCVQRDECPRSASDCRYDEVWQESGNSCILNCKTYDKFNFCYRTDWKGCYCPDPLIRGPEGECIPKEKCPNHMEKAAFGNETCPPMEHFLECACPLTCSNYDQNFTCLEQCVEGCFCKEPYVRGPDGTCILPNQCLETQTESIICPPEEEYQKCGTACPSNCTNYDESITCRLPCVEGCFCKEPLIRGPDGNCIHPNQCLVIEKRVKMTLEMFYKRHNIICKDDEHFTWCSSFCPDNCDNYKDPQRRCKKICIPGCECQKGYVKGRNGVCIEPEKCEERTCPENEQFIECGTACPKNCTNYDKDIPCIEHCVPGCFCKDPMVRGPDGKCIFTDECSQERRQCPTSEEYQKCGTACPRNCTNYNEDIPCVESCVEGCFCKDPLVRGFDDKCVFSDECLKDDEIHKKSIMERMNELGTNIRQGFPCYAANQVYDLCTSLCPLTCYNYQKYPNGRVPCNMMCVPGCKCKKGYVLYERRYVHVCIPKEECRGLKAVNEISTRSYPSFPAFFCKANEEFSLCSSLCPDNCDNYQNPNRFCKLICVPGCKCKQGFIKGRDGVCIQPEQCEEKRPEDCSTLEEYDVCGSYCERDCNTYNKDELPCEDKRCKRGCFCKQGYVRGPDWECIFPSNCTSTPTARSNFSMSFRKDRGLSG